MTPCNSRRLLSASSMSRSLINIDAQDIQDYLLSLVWVLRDESVHPLEFDHHLFLNNDSQKTAPILVDQRVGLPLQQLFVLLILSILSIDVP